MDEILQTKLNSFLYYVLLKKSPIIPTPSPSHSSLPVKIKSYEKTAFSPISGEYSAVFRLFSTCFFMFFSGVKIKSNYRDNGKKNLEER
jgi:hypothetical protein